MASKLLRVAVPLLLFVSLLRATAAQEAAPTEAYDAHEEVEKLKGWKAYLSGEVDKCKAELTTEQQRIGELTAQVAQFQQAAADAVARATAAESRAATAEAQLADANARITSAEEKATLSASKAAEAEAQASSYATYYTQLSAQVEQLKQDVAASGVKAEDAETRASAHKAAAEASHSEAAVLRQRLAEATSQLEGLEARVAELASATAKAGGLKGHARAIYDILVDEAARHRKAALNYANVKLPGFKAKVAEVHATVSSKLPNVTGHMGQFVGQVDGELRPWLRKTLGSVPALKHLAEDPVALQGAVYLILAAPVLLLLLPLLSICFRLATRRPEASTGRIGDIKPSKRNKRKQG